MTESQVEPSTMEAITDQSQVMDLSKLNLPEVKPTRFQCGELGRLDHWKVVVASRLLKKSFAATVQTAVYTYLQRNWEQHEERLIVEANNRGMTPEELFMEIVQEESTK